MLCQHFLDMQLLCFLYKPYYAHIMLGYVLRPETHATCSSEECTFCSDVDDATKAKSTCTVASYPGLPCKSLKVQLLILNLLLSFKVHQKCQLCLKRMLFCSLKHCIMLCICIILCLKLCWHNPPRPTNRSVLIILCRALTKWFITCIVPEEFRAFLSSYLLAQ